MKTKGHVHHTKRWERLDNTAHLFPVIATDTMTNTYRISCVLKEPVDPEYLQQALDLVTPKFPGFNVRLRRGIFWYYLEENGKKAPYAAEEHTYPCRLIHPSRNNSYLFRISYYRCRINLEVFHVLADGKGGLGFLQELVYQYLRLAHEELHGLPDTLNEHTSLDREDSYLSNFHKGNGSAYRMTPAAQITGKQLPQQGFRAIHEYMSVSQVKEAAKGRYGLSINEYLVSVFVWSIYQQLKKKRQLSASRPIRVAVPVNLRPFFESDTTKNFFVMVSAEFQPNPNDWEECTFSEVAERIKSSLREQINKEHLESIFSFNVANQKIFAARLVPLPLKNLAMRFFYTRAAYANTTTITNLGNIPVEEPYQEYIDMFHTLLPISTGQKLKGTVTSFGDRLCFAFTSVYQDADIPTAFLRQLESDGIQVQTESNLPVPDLQADPPCENSENTSENYPDIPHVISAYQRITRILMLLMALIGAGCITANLLLTPGSLWSAIVIATLLYASGLMQMFARDIGYLRRIFLGIFGGVCVTIFSDGITGFHGWSRDFVIPSAMLLFNLSILLLFRINRRNWASYIQLQLLMAILALISLMCVFLGMIQFPWLVYINTALALISLLGSITLGHRSFREEMTRRFHF